MKYKHSFFSIIIALAFLVIIVIGSLMFGGLATDLGSGLRKAVEDGDLEDKTNALEMADALETDAVGYADNIAFWLLIAVVIGLLISGLFLEFEPLTIAIMFFVSGVAIGMSMLVANMYNEFTLDSSLASVAQEMSLSGAVYGSIFPIIIFIAFILSLVIMYSKKSGGQNAF